MDKLEALQEAVKLSEQLEQAEKVPKDMSLEKAIKVYELTNKCSARRLASEIEDIFNDYPDLNGNQLHGMDLRRDAYKIITKLIEQNPEVEEIFNKETLEDMQYGQ